ncbi:MAG: peroxiredoxin, partial [Chloroflexi bacterium]
FANELSKAGHKPQEISTSATVHFDLVGGGFSITKIALKTEGVVPGIDETTFKKIGEEAKKTCPVSRALTGTQVVLDASLKSGVTAR